MASEPAPGEPIAYWVQRDEHHRPVKVVVGSSASVMDRQLVATVGPEPPPAAKSFRIRGTD
jgi:hypothetical protein